MHHNHGACALEPTNHNYWACILQLLKPIHPRTHALQQEKPLQWEAHILQLKNSPCSPQLEKACMQQQRPSTVQFSSVAQSCPTLGNPMNCSTPGVPVHHQLPEFTQTHVHRVSDAIQPSHPLSSPFPPAPNPSQHQSLFQWVNSSHQVAKVLEFRL